MDDRLNRNKRQGADGYLKDQQTDLSIAASDPGEHDVKGKNHKTGPPVFPDVVPSIAWQAMLAPLRGITSTLPNQPGN